LKQPRTVLTLIPLLVVLIVSCESKKQHAREAIEVVDAFCLQAREHPGIVDVASQSVAKQVPAEVAIEELDYEVQPAYRDQLNRAWESCAYSLRYNTAKRVLERMGHPDLLTKQDRDHLTPRETELLILALDDVKQSAKRGDPANMYPYPED
jgi:predicted glycoside hydrolase/deacetylase ChbG (UPF0249 family)